MNQMSLYTFSSMARKITTPSHPFYVPKLGWTSAIKLRAGDILVLSNGEYVVVEKVQHEILESPVKVYNFEVEDFHTYFVGESSVLVHNRCAPKVELQSSEEIGKPKRYGDIPWYEQQKNSGGKGRGKNNIKPNSNATGKHAVYKTDPTTGDITNYKIYDVNPKNPSGFDEILGYDGVGTPHINKVTGEKLLPHVHDKNCIGGVRKPFPDEIP